MMEIINHLLFSECINQFLLSDYFFYYLLVNQKQICYS